MSELIFYSLIGGLFSLIGGILLLIKPELTQKIITPLISFGAGAFLAAAFLDILPEALESVSEPHPILLAMLIGYILFFVLERLIMRLTKIKQGHEHLEHTESLPFLLILGDCLHNFLDGILIAVAYVANPVLGLPTALAIAAHEIPQEIGDFSVLLHLKWSKAKIITVNILQSLLTIPGVILGFYLGKVLQPQLPLFLGLTSGIFLYIAASDLIPELHHQAGHKYFFRVLIPFVSSIALVYLLIFLTH